jgi:hypothetical protein
MLKFIRIRYILLACLLGMTPSLSSAFVSITIAPPPLVEYEQPLCPGDGYLWEPGYWAWGDDDYYWVPGVWIEAPEVGFLWTPGYLARWVLGAPLWVLWWYQLRVWLFRIRLCRWCLGGQRLPL